LRDVARKPEHPVYTSAESRRVHVASKFIFGANIPTHTVRAIADLAALGCQQTDMGDSPLA
jgi:hypothetical protein